MLEVEDVTVRFGETKALDRASLMVAQGEVVAVLGPSGSGKSTLLRAIAGLDLIESGSIRLNGQDLAGVPTHQRAVGLLFQGYALFPHLTVAGNVGFGLRMQDVPEHEIAMRVAEVLDWVGMSRFAARRVERLSGGEQQRVALARTLAPRPALVMLDEPVAALDRRLRERLVEDIAALLRREQTTAMYVTHDHDEGRVVSDRVAIMREGRIVQTGRYDEIAAAPIDPWVADFVG
ncbi:MAG TPA: ABC transporter ATP-binding protein [Acidimicrobiia bacterium]